MGFFSLQSGTIHGMQAQPVHVEVDISFGLPKFSIVGLPDAAVQESKERIRSALQNSGYAFPKTVITVNLAPAHERKQGSHHDATIALALLAAENLVPIKHIPRVFVAAELGLSGEFRAVRGIIPLALMAKHKGYKHIIVASQDALLLREVPGITAHGCKNLHELIKFLSRSTLPKTSSNSPYQSPPALSAPKNPHPFAHIRGHYLAKRALIIAIAGNHPLLFIGPPGSGKTLLAKSAQYLLPPLTFSQALELSCINSVQKEHASEIFSYIRPFRSPHHQASPAALIGGGLHIVPGEISLAHHGILFLDELPEFPQKSLEALREPLEAREVHIARANGHVSFPANAQLVCAMNPCPCGYFGDTERLCTCGAMRVRRYQERLSGPLLDRIDIFIDLSRISSEELLQEQTQEIEKTFPHPEELLQIRTAQEERIKKSQGSLTSYETLAHPTSDAKVLFRKAIDRLHLSGRGYTRLLRISRTIADLEKSEEILPTHVSEALSYRSRLLIKT